MEQLGKCTKDSMLSWLTGQHKLPHGLSRKHKKDTIQQVVWQVLHPDPALQCSPSMQ